MNTLLLVLTCLLSQDRGSVTLPEGTFDAARERIYVPGEKGGIDVLEASNGQVKATLPFEGDAFPIAVGRDQLLVGKPDPKAANVMRIVVLALPKGDVVRTSDPLTFPDWVNTAGGRGHDFHWSARIEKSTLVISWDARYVHRPMGGPPPPPTPPKLGWGVLKVDLDKGGVTKDDSVEDFVNVLGQENGAFTRPASLGGDLLTAVTIGRKQPGVNQQPMLLRWDPATRKVKESTPIGEVGPQWLRLLADGSHVILPEKASVFAVYSLETGKKVPVNLNAVGAAKALSYAGGADGGRLYTVEATPVPLTREGVSIPRFLRAWSPKADSEKPVWERAVKPGFGRATPLFP
jgi:hypothetical protein